MLFALVLTLNACTKKSGCTEYFAENYDPEAAVDDGSCILLGSMIFYASLSNEELDLFINEKFIGTITPTLNPSGGALGFGGLPFSFGFNQPNCSDPFGLTVEKPVGDYTLIVKGSDTTRNIPVSNTVQCNAIDIDFP